MAKAKTKKEQRKERTPEEREKELHEREVHERIPRPSPNDPLIASENEDAPIVMSQDNVDLSDAPTHMPVLALRDVVIFPYMIFPVLVGRESSLSATSASVSRNKYIFLVAQKNSAVDDPGPADLYASGTLARIVRIIRLPNGLMKVLVDGLEQATATKYSQGEGHLEVDIEILRAPRVRTPELEALVRHTSELFREYVKHSRQLPQEVLLSFDNISDARRKLFYIAAHVARDLESKQRVLEIGDIREQYLHVTALLASELDILRIEQEIDQKVQTTIQKSQRKYFLHEQIKVLQQELGEDVDEQHPELGKLVKAVEDAGLPEAAQTRADEELERLKKTPAMSPEASVIRTYLEWMSTVPWKRRTKDHLNIEHVRDVLDRDHYGLEKPKERILEHIAVLNLVDKMRGQILCLVGPPGVGKTSLARSIAHALGREFVRISLGGVRDEAEIRGHRRTYIGAMPGKIIQSMKRASVVNPLILLDEVDKMSMDFRGDPSSALLEVLDPEQNSTFVDHYLEIEYDLSNVFFVTTANVRYNIPLPLLDRMEVIELPGYLEHDKLEIAKQHIIPNQLRAHGLPDGRITIADAAVMRIIRNYTEEAGVRNLVRQTARICRKIARQLVSEAYGTNGAKSKKEKKTAELERSTVTVSAHGVLTTDQKKEELIYEEGEYTREPIPVRPDFKLRIEPEMLEEYLGVPRYHMSKKELSPKIGAVMGLAWTSTGGDVLPVEVVLLQGSERLTLTGQLGDVMKESAQAALSYIRSRHKELDIEPNFTKDKEIHVHLPEGAIPKDGPSAGITLIMAIISAVTCKPARGDIAMTGEITLRGHVLPIGGLQEKLLAAKRVGITTVLIPEENVRSLPDIPDRIKEGLNIISIATVDQAIPIVFDLTTPSGQLKRLVPPSEETVEVEQALKREKAKKLGKTLKATVRTNGKSKVKPSSSKKPIAKKKR